MVFPGRGFAPCFDHAGHLTTLHRKMNWKSGSENEYQGAKTLNFTLHMPGAVRWYGKWSLAKNNWTDLFSDDDQCD